MPLGVKEKKKKKHLFSHKVKHDGGILNKHKDF